MKIITLSLSILIHSTTLILYVSSFLIINNNHNHNNFFQNKLISLPSTSTISYCNTDRRCHTITKIDEMHRRLRQCTLLSTSNSNNNDIEENGRNMEENVIGTSATFQNEMTDNNVLLMNNDIKDTTTTTTTMSNSVSKQVSEPSNKILWDVYICQSKNSKERGADATLGAFIGLSSPTFVSVHAAYIHKSKGKGPTIRCIQRTLDVNDDGISFEVNNVDSVDKVYNILSSYMGLKNIEPSAAECFKFNYKGNAHLDKGEITEAIESYNKAISTGYKDQEGVILVMRATAYLQRAFRHRKQLKVVVQELQKTVLPNPKLHTFYQLALQYPMLSTTIFTKMVDVCRVQDTTFQQIKFRHGLYENALLHATRDSLRATQLLPHYAKTWLRAGDSLAELRKYKESASYYEKALLLDDTLTHVLVPMIQKLEDSQVFLDNARASGWSDDTLRISLDVAG